MNIFVLILFSTSIIRLIIYLLKNNRNPNKNNTTIKEYKFSQKSEEVEIINHKEKTETDNTDL